VGAGLGFRDGEWRTAFLIACRPWAMVLGDWGATFLPFAEAPWWPLGDPGANTFAGEAGASGGNGVPLLWILIPCFGTVLCCAQ